MKTTPNTYDTIYVARSLVFHFRKWHRTASTNGDESNRNKNHMMRIYATLAMLVAGCLLVAGYYFLIFLPRNSDPYAECRGGSVGGGAIGGPFTLIDDDGRAVTDQDVITKPSLIYFGYTFCPDVCPLDNVRNADASDVLSGRGLDMQPVFITIDPARDTPEIMKSYAQNIHPKMIGLTGSDAQVSAAASAYKVYFHKQADGDPEYYLMEHTTLTYLVLPKIGFVDFFRRDTVPDAVADKVACYLEKTSP